MYTPVKIESPVIVRMQKDFVIRDAKAQLKHNLKFKKL